MKQSESTDISVIVPSYRPGNYILECLDSLRGQTFPSGSFEVLVVLNGCNEPYSSMLRSYASAHPGFRMRLFQTDTGGVSNARNLGLDNAGGKFIAFVDDDDILSSGYLESLFRDASGATVTLCGIESFDDVSRRSLPPDYIGRGFRRLRESGAARFRCYQVSKCLNSPCGKLIPASLIGKRRFNTSFSNGEDCLFVFSIVDRNTDFILAGPDAVYHRRVRSESLTNSLKKRSYWLRNWMKGVVEYSRIYFSSIGSRSFRLYVNRVLGITKSHLLKFLRLR